MIIRLLGITLASLSLPTFMIGQHLNYDIYRGTEWVGEMDAHLLSQNGWETYQSNARMTLEFFVEVDLEFKYEAVYQGRNLQSTFTKNLRSGDIQDASYGRRVGHDYLNDVDGSQKKLSNASIDYSLLCLYFQEPQGRNKVYSERFGAYLPLKDLGNHRYELTQSNGYKTIYSYKQGICHQVEVQHALATVTFQLKDHLNNLATGR